MTYDATINHVLVVLNAELARPETAIESTLLSRAVALAKHSGCRLELFHIRDDAALDLPLIGSRKNQDERKRSVTDTDATRLEELVTRLQKEGVEIAYEARWDCPRTDAILRKIAQSGADLVMKTSREHAYILGIASNTEWELVRRSPAHVWLVNDAQAGIERLLAAFGNRTEDTPVTTATDHAIAAMARSISHAFDADVYPVNAYLSPTAIPVPSAGGAGAPMVPVAPPPEESERLMEKHEAELRSLCLSFLFDPARLRVCEGDPGDVIPQVAGDVDANMIVIGAHSIGRLERMISDVTVEPVIAETSADILVVRGDDAVDVPAADLPPVVGRAEYDLENALTDPAGTFESPREVLAMHEISAVLRRRILQAWEYDIKAQMVGVDEGGPVREIDSGTLQEIQAALDELG